MPRSKDNTDVVLRLVDGRSDLSEIILVGGRARAPFAVGGQAGWCVSAAHVASTHVMLAFNGERLFVCAARGEMALLDGLPLDARWTEAAMPSELRFGGARVSIGRRAGPDDTTQVPDDEVTRIADELQVAAAAGARTAPRPTRDGEATCFDDERLQAALRLCTPGEDVTRIADVEVPDAAKGPSNDATTTPPAPPAPAPRPANHTVRLVRRQSPPRLPDSARTLAAPVRPPTPEPQSASGIMTTGLLAGLGSNAIMHCAAIAEREERFSAAVAESASGVSSSCVPSSMPPTIPSDGLISAAMPAHLSPFPVAVARPSSPTIAIPEPVAQRGSSAEHGTPPPFILDSFHAPACAMTGERPATTANASTASVLQQKLGELGSGWKQASLPKKAIALLMVPALIGALFTMRPAKPPSDSATEQVAITTPTTVASTKPAPESPTLPSAPRKQPRPFPAAAGPRDARTDERRALDTAASGHDGEAADQYEALASSRPDNLAFSEAARILRARSETRHD